MLFELIDSKKICDSCFVGGQIVPFNEASDLSHTWDYSSLLSDKQYDLAKLYANFCDVFVHAEKANKPASSIYIMCTFLFISILT